MAEFVLLQTQYRKTTLDADRLAQGLWAFFDGNANVFATARPGEP